MGMWGEEEILAEGAATKWGYKEGFHHSTPKSTSVRLRSPPPPQDSNPQAFHQTRDRACFEYRLYLRPPSVGQSKDRCIQGTTSQNEGGVTSLKSHLNDLVAFSWLMELRVCGTPIFTTTGADAAGCTMTTTTTGRSPSPATTVRATKADFL